MPPRGKPIDRIVPALEEVRSLVELMNSFGLTEIEVERGGVRIRLRRDHPQASSTPSGSLTSSAPSAGALEVVEHATSGLHTIEAPMVGTFYRAPAPDAPPFVKEGDLVKEGQTLCVIEAMKLMNEIEAKIGGRIVKIFVENSQPVEYGQPLFLVEPA
ncbi:MAG TPA: acetyl-CoA carboxylase biotin carboxyl carrier protein [Methylomirabilota bacterium]|nr:acetyl-CoA carboxylase biotin carboxyl carrier protein [Methylomirabilota bacterium]